MSLREQVHAYIAQLEQRLRWSTLLRGLAIFTGGALVATLVLVTIANALAFSHGSVTAARFALPFEPLMLCFSALSVVTIWGKMTGRGKAETVDPPVREPKKREPRMGMHAHE